MSRSNSSFRLDSEEFDEKLETTDLLETVTGRPSQSKAIKEEENRLKDKETKKEIDKLLIQQVKKNTENEKKNVERFAFQVNFYIGNDRNQIGSWSWLSDEIGRRSLSFEFNG